MTGLEATVGNEAPGVWTMLVGTVYQEIELVQNGQKAFIWGILLYRNSLARLHGWVWDDS